MAPAAHRALCAVASAALLSAALGACQNDARRRKVDKPEAPPMQPILDAFATPTATIAPEAVAALTQAIAARTAAIDTLQVDGVVIDAIAQGLSEVRANGQAATRDLERSGVEVAQQPIDVTGDGYVVVTRICDGWGAVPVPDAANGALTLTAGFTERGLDPVIWGSLFDCKYKLDQRAIEIDGLDPDPAAIDVRAYIGSAVTLENFGAFVEPIVIDVASRVFVDGVDQLGRFTFKIDVATRSFETLVPVGGGYVVAAVALDRSSTVAVRAADGTYACDVAAQRCTTPAGVTLEAPP
jgi:hypothetical protein